MEEGGQGGVACALLGGGLREGGDRGDFGVDVERVV